MNETFFISDTHFGHARALQLFRSGHFKDCKEMDETMITNWNSVVNPRDVVWHMGDFSWGNQTYYARRLNGQLNLILGNHDYIEPLERQAFNSIHDYKKIKINNQKIILFHYPIHYWECSHYGSWHLYGHVHGQRKNIGLSMDVSAECIKYTPISFSEIKVKMGALPQHDHKEDYT